MNLADYLSAERGRAAKVAAALRCSPAFISQMANAGRGVPAERCAAIERATGGAVRRWDLRPADWHLIWPELAGTDGAPDVPEAQAAEAALSP